MGELVNIITSASIGIGKFRRVLFNHGFSSALRSLVLNSR